MKRVVAVATAATLSLALAGCGGGAAQSSSSSADSQAASQQAGQAASQEDSSSQQSADTSTAASSGSTAEKTNAKEEVQPTDAMASAVCDELRSSRDGILGTDKVFPAATILRAYDTGDFVRVFGVFEAYGCSLDGTTLAVESAEILPGSMDLYPSGSGYTAKNAQYAADGSEHSSSIKQMAEGYAGAADALASASGKSDAELTKAFSAYAERYGMEIDSVRMTDGTVIDL